MDPLRPCEISSSFRFSTPSSFGALDLASHSCFSALAAEFVGMVLFVYIGSSSVVGTFNPVSGGAKAQITDIALAFGLTIAALVHSIGHISGGFVFLPVSSGCHIESIMLLSFALL